MALAIFLLYEPRCKDPLVDLRFFQSVPFSSATILALCTFASFAGFLFLNTLYLEQVRGVSAFRTGFFTLPLAIMIIICAPLSGRLVGVHGTRPSLLAAGTGLLLSSLMLTHLNIGTPVVLLMLPYASFGVGYGMVNPAITNNAVAGMPLSQVGVASAIASTSRQVGAALGIAVAGTVVAAGRSRGSDFTQTTHPMWWIMTGCGAVILLLGWVSNTPWAQASSSRVAHLFDNRRHGCQRQNMHLDQRLRGCQPDTAEEMERG
jgi:MFS family permease